MEGQHLDETDLKKPPSPPLKWPKHPKKQMNPNTSQSHLNKKIHQLYLRHTKARITNRKVHTKRGLGKATKAAEKAEKKLEKELEATKGANSAGSGHKKTVKQIKKPRKVRKNAATGGKKAAKNAKNETPQIEMENKQSVATVLNPTDYQVDSMTNDQSNQLVKIIYASPATETDVMPQDSSFQSNNLITESTPVITLYPESNSSLRGFQTMDFSEANDKNIIVLNQPPTCNLPSQEMLPTNIITFSNPETIQSIQAVPAPVSNISTIQSTEAIQLPTTPINPIIIAENPLPQKISAKPIVFSKPIVTAKPSALGKFTLASFQSKGNVKIIKSPDGKVILKATGGDDFKSAMASGNLKNFVKAGTTAMTTTNIGNSQPLKNMQIITTKSSTKNNLVLMQKIFNPSSAGTIGGAGQPKTKNLILSPKSNVTTISPVDVPSINIPAKINKINIIDQQIIEPVPKIQKMMQNENNATKVTLKKSQKIDSPITGKNISLKFDSSIGAAGGKLKNFKGNLTAVIPAKIKAINQVQTVTASPQLSSLPSGTVVVASITTTTTTTATTGSSAKVAQSVPLIVTPVPSTLPSTPSTQNSASVPSAIPGPSGIVITSGIDTQTNSTAKMSPISEIKIVESTAAKTITKTDWENELDQATAPNKISTSQYIEKTIHDDDEIMDDEDFVSDYIMEEDEDM